jgi:ferredoxin
MAEHGKVEADREVCIGSGVCLMYAPQAFGMDVESKVALIGTPDVRSVEVQAAVEGCPTGALSISDAD